MGLEIQKDELIQFHAFLLHVRNHLECIEKNCDQDAFSSYDSLNVAPQQVNRSKDEHKLAVFELCKGISEMVMVEDSSALHKICKNLENLYARFR